MDPRAPGDPDRAEHAIPVRRRTPRALRPLARPVRRAHRRGVRDDAPAARDGHLPPARARAVDDREGHRQPRPGLEGTRRPRRRRGLAPRGDRGDGCTLRHALETPARDGRSAARALEGARGELPGRDHSLPGRALRSQARAVGRPACPSRRPRREGVPAPGPHLRRLVPARREPRRVRRRGERRCARSCTRPGATRPASS